MRRRPCFRPAQHRLGVLLGIAVLALTSCSGPQSALNSAGPKAGRIEALWWALFAVATLVCLVVFAFVAWAVLRRRGEHVTPRLGGEKVVVGAGLIATTLILIATFAGGLVVMQLNRNPPEEPALTIEVIGHDWWWEVRYPDFVTANEIQIPVGRPIHFELRTADVIHSFWVPPLSHKIDMVPNIENDLWLQADRVGEYEGQCAEYCGTQHAGMKFVVIAQPVEEFEEWYADQAQPAIDPEEPLAVLGQQVFQEAACATCHTIRGTDADGDIGPDLTHFDSRQTIGAGVAPNDPGWLGGWISNSQTIKPGNLMPPQPLGSVELRALIAYLETLE